MRLWSENNWDDVWVRYDQSYSAHTKSLIVFVGIEVICIVNALGLRT